MAHEVGRVGLSFALAAAALWGGSDFLGGLTSRRRAPSWVAMVASLAGLGVAVSFALAIGGAPSARSILFGGLAGVGDATGFVLLYRGLAAGSMSSVAPIAGATGAGVAVVGSLVTGDTPSPLGMVGVVLALITVLTFRSGGDDDERADLRAPCDRRPGWTGHPLVLSIGAGCGFGVFFIGFRSAGGSSIAWSLVGCKATCFLTLAVAVAAAGIPVRRRAVAGVGVGAALVVGTLEVAGTVCYGAASGRTSLAVAAVTSSLYPVMTALLAVGMLRQRLRRSDAVGLVLGVAAIALVGLGSA